MSRSLSGGLAIDENIIRRIFSLNSRYSSEKSEITIDLDGGYSISSKNIDDIFSDSAINTKGILELYLRTYSRQPKFNASVRIRKGGFTPLSYSCSGERATCISYQNEMDNEIYPSKTWYSFLYQQEFIVFTVWAIIFGIVSPYFLYKYSFKDVNTYLFIFSLSACWTFLFVLMRRVLFPKIVFLIGQSRKHETYRRNISGFLFFGIVVTIAVGVFTNYLSDKIK